MSNSAPARPATPAPPAPLSGDGCPNRRLLFGDGSAHFGLSCADSPAPGCAPPPLPTPPPA
jgi:hypothetical protein